MTPGQTPDALRSLGRAVDTLDRFGRIHFLGYSCLWALLGAASVDTSQQLLFWVGLAGVCSLFHLFGILLNDVVDLPVDRGQPSRARDPLVRGAITPKQALGLALLLVPAAFFLSARLGASLAAHAWLAAAFVTMTVYDVYGKRCLVPPLTDAAQGASWACITIYGAALAGKTPTTLTFAIAGAGLAYTLLINGVHGGMRDLANDFRCGARTTALWLGMRPEEGEGIRVPTAAHWYCWPLVGALVGLAVLASAAAPGDSAGRAFAGAIGLIATSVLSAWGMRRVLIPGSSNWRTVFRLHLVALLLPTLWSVLAHLPKELSVGIGIVFFAPLTLLVPPLVRKEPPSATSDPNELLIAVGEDDRDLRPLSREICHRGEGVLHRAFSVYLFDAEARILLQQRGVVKKLWPLHWSNSCCGHPRWGERIDVAARRRVREELGIDVPLRHVFRFTYHARFGAPGSEREVCWVFVGRLPAPANPDREEIAALRLASFDEVESELKDRPDDFTPWFRMAWPRVQLEADATNSR